MNRELYKSSVNKIRFDDQLEEKTLNYINQIANKERVNIMKNTNKSKWKMKMSASTAVAACAVCVLSVTAYAAVANIDKVSHNDYGFVSNTNMEINDKSISTKELEEFLNTSEIRTKMANDNSGMELISEENGKDGVNWSKKSTFKDNSYTYTSDDTTDWSIDEEASTGIITEYAYENYEMAIKDAGLPNVMEKILSKGGINKGAFLEEYSTEESSDISKKRVIGEFDYKNGKVSVDLSKYSMTDGIQGNGYSVITGIDKSTNQREYQSQNGIKYQLSDNKDDKITKTTTMVSSGSYCLIIEFEGLSDNEIHTILDSLDLSGFNI